MAFLFKQLSNIFVSSITMTSQYAIKDLERLSGIKAHTLRIWEQRYGILKPDRTDTNIRFYSANDLKKILNISLLNNNGFKISKIAKLKDDEVIKLSQSILNNYTKESDQIDNLIVCMMEMNESKFEKVISNCILHFGFENTFEKILFPFMRQIGSMWQTGIVNAAQEHFISHLIRQKLIVGIDGLYPETIENPKTFLFYLPNGELHELGLLYCHFLTKTKGYKCVYLGQSVPFEDMLEITKTVTPDVIVTIITSTMNDSSTQDYVNKLAKSFTKSSILVSGRNFFDNSEPITLPKSVYLFKSYEDYRNKLQSATFVNNEVKTR